MTAADEREPEPAPAVPGDAPAGTAAGSADDAAMAVAGVTAEPSSRLGRWATWHPDASAVVIELAVVAWFVALAWRLKWIADDGYIYLTHVQNWVENGAGPNFNAGERVEGYTSVAWFALLSFADLVRIDRIATLEQTTIVVSVVVAALAALTWIAIERAALRTADRTTDRWVVNAPLALFAGGYVFRTYATSGLETPLIMWWTAAAIWVLWQRRPNVVVAAAIAGVGPLVRPDLAVISAGLVVVIATTWWRGRSLGDAVPRATSVLIAALVVVPLSLSEVVRISYYGQLLPNTYYAKTDTPHGWSDGWRYLRDTAGPYGLVWLAAIAIGAVVWGAVTERRTAGATRLGPVAGRRVGLLVLAALSAAFAMSVGGDFMHGRTLIPAWMLLLGALSGVATEVVRRAAGSIDRAAIATAGSALLAAALVLTQLPLTSRQSRQGPLIIDGIADEMRFYEGRNPNVHRFGAENLDPLAARGRDLAALADRLGTEIGAAFGPVGMTSYYGMRDNGDVYIYDVHGLTQPAVARVEPAATGTRVGHSHRATEPMVVVNSRVDFSSLSLEGYDDAFTVHVGTSEFVLINLRLIEPLRIAHVIGDADVERMHRYLVDHLIGDRDTVDPNLVALLTWRLVDPNQPPNDPISRRVVALQDLLAESSWAQWLADNGDALATLSTYTCGAPPSCWPNAFDMHGVDPIPFLEPGALAPPG